MLQLYDKHVNLSIIGYFGVVRTISLHQDQLPANPSGSQEEAEQAFSTSPIWVRNECRYGMMALVITTTVYAGCGESISKYDHLFYGGSQYLMIKNNVSLVRAQDTRYLGSHSWVVKLLAISIGLNSVK